MMQVSQSYLDGIREGREWLTKYPDTDAAEMHESAKRCCKITSPQSETGQMHRGERDFWKNQMKREG